MTTTFTVLRGCGALSGADRHADDSGSGTICRRQIECWPACAGSRLIIDCPLIGGRLVRQPAAGSHLQTDIVAGANVMRALDARNRYVTVSGREAVAVAAGVAVAPEARGIQSDKQRPP